ncbi:MAG: HlyC/CorC family transporter [Dehalococcoidia bacterium]|nr:HlyC/CorC family transporter [Dehalococcoidia bacterium]
MSQAVWIEIGVLGGGLLVLALVSGSRASLAGIRRSWLWRVLSTSEDAGLQLEEALDSLRSTLVPFREAAIVALVLAAVLLAAELGDNRWWAITAAGVGTWVFVIVVQASGARVAARNPNKFFMVISIPLGLINVVVQTVTRGAPLSSEAVHMPSDAKDESEAPVSMLEEFRTLRDLVRSPEGSGEIGEAEKRMINAVMSLRETTVKELMVPRPDIVSASTEATLEEVVALITERGHTRIPLYEGSLDKTVGVLYARDVLRALSQPERQTSLRQIARPPFFVPEQKKAHELMRDFLAKSVHFALVVDEYGGVEGVVTLKDLLAEIVGDIEQELAPPDTRATLLSADEALFDGEVTLDDVNDMLGVKLESAGFETIGGYVMAHLGRMPRAGDRLAAGDLYFEILSITGRRIRKLRVRKRDQGQTAAPSSPAPSSPESNTPPPAARTQAVG